MSRSEGQGLAVLLSKSAGAEVAGGKAATRALSGDEEHLDRLQGLLEEYEKADSKKDKARALRAFVRLSNKTE